VGIRKQIEKRRHHSPYGIWRRVYLGKYIDSMALFNPKSIRLTAFSLQNNTETI